MTTPTSLRRTAAVAAIGVGALLASGTVAAADEHPAAQTAASGVRPVAELTLHGDAMVHTFDTSDPGDYVEGSWVLANSGTLGTAFDGVFTPVDEHSRSLAGALAVEYGLTDEDGTVTSWAEAGTLAAPVSYAAAHGGGAYISGAETTVIPVRLTLVDPKLLEGDPGDDHTVGATFSINYLSPGGDGGGGAGDGGDGADGDAPAPEASVSDDGILATTGAQIFGWLLLALAAVTVGSRLRRRRSAD